MWPLPPLDNQVVTITFQPQHLCCSWITQTHGRAPLSLRAYQRFPLQQLELERLTIFNPTRIKKKIATFLHKHKLSHAFIIFGLNGPELKEKIVTLDTASPTRDDFVLPTTKDLLWDFCYLYPKGDGKFIFYVYGIPQYLLFQYQLLAITAQLNVIKITPLRMALLHMYKFIYGPAFRTGQLAQDMLRHNNIIENVFSKDMISRIVEVPVNLEKQNELPYVLQSCSLFVSERSIIS